MFRRLSNSLPEDPEFPVDLEKLGYFVNDQDQIRMIKDPDQEFHYFISKNDRVLEKQREAMDTCIRQILATRFQSQGLQTTRLPTNAGPADPHIPILTTSNISSASRIILYMGEANQDLGIFAYRTIGHISLAAGSVLNFAAEALTQDPNVAIVIANTGQLLWNRRQAKAMTMKSWSALPRKTGVSAGTRIGDGNKVPGHEGQEEHVGSVFNYLAEAMSAKAKVEVVGICEGIEAGLEFLDEHWTVWKGRVSAIAVGLGYLWDIPKSVKDEDFKKFIAKRTRAYLIHEAPAGTPLSGRDQMGCNAFSSGESQYTECIMPKAYSAILDFFRQVNSMPDYAEPVILNDLDESDPSRPEVSWIQGSDDARGRITVSGPDGSPIRGAHEAD